MHWVRINNILNPACFLKCPHMCNGKHRYKSQCMNQFWRKRHSKLTWSQFYQFWGIIYDFFHRQSSHVFIREGVIKKEEHLKIYFTLLMDVIWFLGRIQYLHISRTPVSCQLHCDSQKAINKGMIQFLKVIFCSPPVLVRLFSFIMKCFPDHYQSFFSIFIWSLYCLSLKWI